MNSPSSALIGSLAGLLAASLLATDSNTLPKSPPERTSPKIFDERFLEELRELHGRMENLWDRAWRETKEELRELRDRRSFASGLEVIEEPDRILVRLSVPVRLEKNVEVKIEPDQTLRVTLRVEPRERSEEKREPAITFYEQVIRLSEPVESAKMELDRDEGILTVILPRKDLAPHSPPTGP